LIGHAPRASPRPWRGVIADRNWQKTAERSTTPVQARNLTMAECPLESVERKAYGLE
jgi:hypothetical protein